MPNNKPNINLDEMDFGHTIRGLQKDDCVFERFSLCRLLGRGGMGVVWLANDQRLGRDVALKFAPEVVRWDDLAVEELKEETRKGLQLAHPNIVKIYDFLLDEEHAAISMEFIDGENLSLMRTRQPNRIFEVRHIIQWTVQLLDALDYAHRAAKVIHRDLKPANLMIDREGNLRVTDFGIARSISDALDRATMGGASTGTLAYMSPQQAAGKKPHVTDDIYALGSTLYELLTGKPPFFTGNIAQQLNEEPPVHITARRIEFGIANSEPIPEAWESAILACLAKTPEERPTSIQEVRERLGLASIRGATTPLEAPTPGPQPGAMPAVGSELSAMPTARLQTQPPLSTGNPPSAALPIGPNTQRGATPAATMAKLPPPPLPGPPPQTSPLTTSTAHHTTQPPLAATITQAAITTGPAPLARPAPSGIAQTQPRKSNTAVWLVMLFLMFVGLLGMGGTGWWYWRTHPHSFSFFAQAQEGQDSKQKPGKNDPPSDNGSGAATGEAQDPAHLQASTGSSSSSPSTGNTPTGTGATGMPADSHFVGEPGKNDARPPEKSQDPGPFTTIQNAIDRAAPGTTVIIPAGSYEEALTFKDGIHLEAAVGKVVVNVDGQVASAIAVRRCQSGSIKGFTFKHGGSEVTDKDRFPVVMIQSSSILMEDCEVLSGVGDGISVVGAGKPILRRVQSTKHAKNGLKVSGGATLTVEQCESHHNGGSGISVYTTGSSVTLTGVTSTSNGESGILITDGGSAILTKDNKLDENERSGITVDGEGSILRSTGSQCNHNQKCGIIVSKGAKAQIELSQVRDNQGPGMYVHLPAPGTEVRDNIVENSVNDGIQIQGDAQSGVVVSGNKCNRNAFGGLFISGLDKTGFKPLVERNEAHDNGQYGLAVVDQCGGQFRNNIIGKNTKPGIDKENSPDAVFEGNDESGKP